MCQSASSVWALYRNGQKEKIVNDAIFVRQEGPNVVVYSLETEPEQFFGTIAEVDAMSQKILLRVESRVTVELEEVMPATAG
jgi:predicted RNA-binding protein